MNRNELLNELQTIYSLLNAEEMPETHSYLDYLLSEEDFDDSPERIAVKLSETDEPEPLPGFVIDFITEVLECEIENGND